ncbi:DUF1206 domain-containing protein [Teredinibacter turnerae]|uniref:DUF1206 domain-containing protein n=1 Tax=Teredinibacter turnerae TaxID=2426 RepID=UPI00037A74F5|nr:DUF1206 domain-containing protein [Teredinibacter turnerae]
MHYTETKENFKVWARTGYASRGLIYVIVGTLAVFAAVGSGGEVTDSKGALQKIMEQPFGYFLIILLSIGLCGYSVWRFIQAVKDTDDHGTDAKGLAIRGGLLVSCLVHLFLAYWAMSAVFGSQQDSGGVEQSGWLDSTIGQIGLAIVGACVFGAGIAHIVKGWTAKFERHMDIPDTRSVAKILCQFGLIARGVVWCILGSLLLHSALIAHQGEISGMADALHTIQESDYGTGLFSVIAFGLVAFGVYGFLEAGYRRINA